MEMSLKWVTPLFQISFIKETMELHPPSNILNSSKDRKEAQEEDKDDDSVRIAA